MILKAKYIARRATIEKKNVEWFLVYEYWVHAQTSAYKVFRCSYWGRLTLLEPYLDSIHAYLLSAMRFLGPCKKIDFNMASLSAG